MERVIAPVPRNLRVRASVQLGTTRVPARAFLLAATVLVLGGVAVVGGANLLRTVYVASGLIVVGLLVLEGRLWGRSTPAIAALLLRHLRRPKRLRLDPLLLTLPAESATALVERRPRWKT